MKRDHVWLGMCCSAAGIKLIAGGMDVQVSRLPMIYEVNIFLTNRHLPIPEVLPSERLLVEQKGACGFYHVIARCARTGCRSAY